MLRRAGSLVVGVIVVCAPALSAQTVAGDRFRLNPGPCAIRSGGGSPEGIVTGNPCDVYVRTDAGVGQTVYVKESGAGTATGWKPLQSSSSHLGYFAATTSAQLASVVTDETGSGALVFATSPVLVGNLTVDNGTLFVDAAADRVGVGTMSPGYRLDVAGLARLDNAVIGDVGHGPGWAGFSHVSRGGPSSYSVLSNDTGAYTFLNVADLPGAYLGFRVGNLDKVVIDREGDLRHPSYVSQTTAWQISSAGEADFRYLFTDELHAKSFIADLEMALAGGQIISKSVAMVSQTFTCPAAGGTTTLWVRDLPSAANMAAFEANDWVVLRTFSRSLGSLTIADCVGTVSAYTDGAGANEGQQSWTFTRGAAGSGGTMASGAQVAVDSLALDYGVSGNGYWEVNAIDGAYGENSPYAQVVTWATAPVAANRTVRARLGRLRGITGSATEYGLIAGTYAATNGAYFRASNENFDLHGITARWWDGAANVVTIAPNGGAPYVGVGNPAPSSCCTSPGVFLGWTVGDVAAFSAYSNASNYLTWDGSKLTWKAANTTLDASGNLTATNATLSGSVNATAGYFGDSANRVAIESSGLSVGSTGSIRGGQTAYDTGTGFWLGNDGGTYKVSLGVGGSARRLTWDGAALALGDAITIDSSGAILVRGFSSGAESLLRDDDFTEMPDFPATWDTWTPAGPVFGRGVKDPSSGWAIPQRWTLFVMTQSTPGGPVLLQDLVQREIPVVAGRRYEASGYLGQHRGISADVGIAFYDSAGNNLAETHGNAVTTGGGATLAAFGRSCVLATAPATAVKATYIARQYLCSTPGGSCDDPYLFLVYPYFGEAGSTQTSCSPTAGRTVIHGNSIRTGTITASRIAAGTITGDRIAAATITGDLIAAGTITAEKLSVTTLSAISANLGTVTAGTIDGLVVRGGQTAYDTGTGFWLGNSGGTYKLSIGTAGGAALLWDGSALSVRKKTIDLTTNGLFCWRYADGLGQPDLIRWMGGSTTYVQGMPFPAGIAGKLVTIRNESTATLTIYHNNALCSGLGNDVGYGSFLLPSGQNTALPPKSEVTFRAKVVSDRHYWVEPTFAWYVDPPASGSLYICIDSTGRWYSATTCS